jgi:hypothetical protein
MIFSIHIPKTGGTSFRTMLARRFGSGFANYYREDDNTDPRLQMDREEMLRALPKLEAEGLRIVHGHMRAKTLLPAIHDPAQVWIWFRDPVERVISNYFFLRGSPAGTRRVESIRDGQTSLLEFASNRRTANLQSKFLAPLDLERLGFIGLTERYDDCLRLLFNDVGAEPARIVNRTREKPQVDAETRAAIAEANADDIELYARAKALVEARLLALPPPAPPPGPLSRFRARLVTLYQGSSSG